ncbi:hypothetical protein [Rhodopirellula sp. P2]|uniref:hypothetical protein n=1 Tax=Rhodopirellula sp. P2 TaxID=2127060 RepID=UPI0023683518|nr:hypothetical protein [Rhodopirellula sp. P2]WDQ15846.1 hypothetical protein PSR62_19715 [Rhodopirellula sp. P2]
MFTPDHTLRTLLHRTVEQAVRYGKTLVLVTPDELRLQPAFFVALGQAWREANASQQSEGHESMAMPRLRVDWCAPASQGFGWRSLQNKWHTSRCERLLRRENLDDCVQLSQCLLIGKASQHPSTIVLGITNEATELPEWTTPVPMQR